MNGHIIGWILQMTTVCKKLTPRQLFRMCEKITFLDVQWKDLTLEGYHFTCIQTPSHLPKHGSQIQSNYRIHTSLMPSINVRIRRENNNPRGTTFMVKQSHFLTKSVQFVTGQARSNIDT